MRSSCAYGKHATSPHADGEGVFEFDGLRTDVGIAVFALEQEAWLRQERHGRRPEVIPFAARLAGPRLKLPHP